MQERLVLGWRIDVDNKLDVIDMDATCGNICCHQNFDSARRELGKVALASILRQVAVQFNRRNTCLIQLLDKLLGAVLRSGEQQRSIGTRCQTSDNGQLRGLFDRQQVMGHCLDW